ncbi:MAG TPA: hemerythrin domain-containing protein [Burkholderiales bacterium]|jgi:hemerythrin superfamily protein|nr:hemerythrin domain-containing protein [Burkholderiales bacterium]
MDLDTALNDKAPHSQRATDLLRADHQEISALFDDYQQAMDDDSPVRETLAQTICMQLDLHNRIELEVFYPIVRAEDVELIDEATQDHQEMAELINSLQGLPSEDANFDTRMLDLMDIVESHIATEEEELFPLLEDRIDATLRHLCTEIIRYKEQLVGSTQDVSGRA